jgi:predicted aspartyl protease
MSVELTYAVFRRLRLERSHYLVSAVLSLALCAQAQQAPLAVVPSRPLSATVPMFLEDNRVFVELTFRRPDGSPRKARAWVDTGGGWFAITEPLAKEIGVTRSGDDIQVGDGHATPIAHPDVRLGEMPLDLSTANVYEVLGETQMEPGINAEAFLPARVLMHYDAIFDYPARLFTLARSGALKPRGERIVATVNLESGFPRVEISVGGERYGFLVDTGAAYTMISRELLEKWGAAHSNWPKLDGAVAEANMIGNEMDTNALLVRISRMELGPLPIDSVGAVSRRAGIFETSMSRMMTAPIVGAIAGNVLKTMRIEIDYPGSAIYVQRDSQPDANDLDCLGLILRVGDDGKYTVVGIARKGGRPVVDGIQTGDELISLDGLNTSGATLDAVNRSLHGRPGDKRKVRLSRQRKEIELEVTVQRLL